MVRRRDGVCISIILISAPGIELKLGSVIQKMASFGSGEKSVIYRLDIIFTITHVVQLMVSKIDLFCQRNICRYP